MKNVKKVLALVLVLALTVATTIGATVAYLKDTDEAKNTMALGNVKIYQNEQQKTIGDELDNDKQFETIRKKEDGFEDFEQNKKLLPMVDGRKEGEALKGNDGLYNPAVKNVVDKIVSVTNYGKEAAYIRTIIAFEGGYEKIYAEGSDTEYTEKNIHDEYIGVNGTYDYLKDDADKFVTIELNGVKYTLAVCVYEEPVAAGATTDTSLRQIFLAPSAGNEAYELFGDKYDILVLSQGVQIAGFDNATQALNEAFGEVTAETAETWFAPIA